MLKFSKSSISSIICSGLKLLGVINFNVFVNESRIFSDQFKLEIKDDSSNKGNITLINGIINQFVIEVGR